MAKKLGVSLRIDEDVIDQLDTLADATQRDRSFLITEAIDNYLEVQKWQIEHIKASIKQADQGEFVSDLELKKFLKK